MTSRDVHKFNNLPTAQVLSNLNFRSHTGAVTQSVFATLNFPNSKHFILQISRVRELGWDKRPP